MIYAEKEYQDVAEKAKVVYDKIEDKELAESFKEYSKSVCFLISEISALAIRERKE